MAACAECQLLLTLQRHQILQKPMVDTWPDCGNIVPQIGPRHALVRPQQHTNSTSHLLPS
jgi:hypothetical protein